jgi:Ca-activated chloride channel family protein
MNRSSICAALAFFILSFVGPPALSLPKPCQVEGTVTKLVTTHRLEVKLTKGQSCLADIIDGPRRSIQIVVSEGEFRKGSRIRANVVKSDQDNSFNVLAIEKIDASDAGGTTNACPDGVEDDWQGYAQLERRRQPMQSKQGIEYLGPKQGAAKMKKGPTGTGSNVGLATGGAKDINNFRRNIDEGYTPLPNGIRHEGLFYDYRFDVGADQPCNKLFCPTFEAAVSQDPFVDKKDHYLAVGLKSGLKELKRPPLNIAVVLDISGSMNSGFSQYYYDKYGKKHEIEGGEAEKIAVAREVLSKLTEQLRPEDRLSIVLYNNGSHVAKPFRRVECTKMDAIRKHIKNDIEATGGTNMSAGMTKAKKMFDGLDEDARAFPRSNRLIFLTDAMPNLGDTGENSLQGVIKGYADERIYTTFTGVGLDADSELIQKLTQIKGTNAYFVNSEKQFKERLNDEFTYMVTPLAFDVRLTVESDAFEVKRAYGTGTQEKTDGTFIEIPTFFPSPTTEEGSKGSIMLAELEQTAKTEDREVKIRASYRKRNRKGEVVERTYVFPRGKEESYTGDSVRKGVVLSRWGDLLREWSESAYRENSGHEPEPDDEIYRRMGVVRPLSEWERRSVKLYVSPDWKRRFGTFEAYLTNEGKAVTGTSFEKELKLLRQLREAPDKLD